jgi:excisionase family DNA binding protein
MKVKSKGKSSQSDTFFQSSGSSPGTSTPTPEPLLRLDQAAALLNISSRSLRRLVRRRELGYVRVGPRGIRFEKPALDIFIARHRVKEAA